MPEIEPKDTTIGSLEGIHLWHAPMSSCSQRVRIALAEFDKSYVSHLIDLEKGEHATAAYQAIHPKGLVPALVDDGRLYIESIDIIQHVVEGSDTFMLANISELLQMADAAQLDLKLLTFEFLFRSGPPPEAALAQAFQKNHQNGWLKQFKVDFANGFDIERIDAAVRRTAAGFQHLESVLREGRTYLSGETFGLADIAWMPNFHRFQLMDWPFEKTPNLQAWFARVSARASYQTALLDWQPEIIPDAFSNYTQMRQAEGTDVRAYGGLRE